MQRWKFYTLQLLSHIRHASEQHTALLAQVACSFVSSRGHLEVRWGQVSAPCSSTPLPHVKAWSLLERLSASSHPPRQEAEGHENGEVTLQRSCRPDRRARHYVKSHGVQRNLVAFLFADNLARVANGGPENQIRFRSGHGLDGCRDSAVRRGSILPNLSTRRSCRPTGSRGLGQPVLFSTVRFPADAAVT